MEQIRRERILTIPNILTLVRIALLPAIVWRYQIGDTLGAFLAYVIAMVTDAVDGIIARRFNQITALGKLLDPLADKLSLLTLLGLFVADGQIRLWVLGLILLKEAAMIMGGAVALKRGIVVYALPIGKVTTCAFIASMIMRFIGWTNAADGMMYVSLALSMAALVWYSLVLMKKLREQDVGHRR